MVGRLVEHQHIGLAQQQAAQCQPGPLAARQLAYLLVLRLFIEAHMREHRSKLAFVCISAPALVLLYEPGVFLKVSLEAFALVIGDRELQPLELLLHLKEVREALLGLRPYRAASSEVVLLAQISHVIIVSYVQIPGCRLYVSGDDAQERTLAGPVGSDYAYTVSFFHTKTDILKNDVCSICLAYVLARDNKHRLKLQSRNSVKPEVGLRSRSVCVIRGRSYHGSVVRAEHRARL